MRISDWSSTCALPICTRQSKDLEPHFDAIEMDLALASCRGRVDVTPRPRRERQPVGNRPHFGNPEPNLYFPKAATPPLGLGAIRQIGRASCRERVCQYV